MTFNPGLSEKYILPKFHRMFIAAHIMVCGNNTPRGYATEEARLQFKPYFINHQLSLIGMRHDEMYAGVERLSETA